MQKKGKIIALAALLILVAGAAVFGMIYGSRQTTAPSGSSGAVNAGRAQIHLSEDNTTASGAGISLDRKKIMINKGGVYYLDGELTDGQIYVKVGDKETVPSLWRVFRYPIKRNTPFMWKMPKRPYLPPDRMR